MDFPNHQSATEEGRHGLQMLTLAVEDTDPRRAVELVSGEGEEVTIERLDVRRMMTDELCSIDEDERAMCMGFRDDLRERWSDPEDVALRGDAHNLHVPLPQELLQHLHAEMAVSVTIDPFDLDAELFFQLQPGDDVAVMLEETQDDHVLFAQVRPSPGFRDEVDRLRAALRKDNLLCTLRMDELLNCHARILVGDRRALGEHVHPSMDVGILLSIELLHPVQNRLRLLCRRGRVEIDKRMAVNRLRKDEKLQANSKRIEHGKASIEHCGFRNFVTSSNAYEVTKKRACSNAPETLHCRLMKPRTIQILSISLFVLLLVWGSYTLLYYLGVPYHGAALMSGPSVEAVAASCDAKAYLCRGLATLIPAVLHTFGRAAPFLWYAIISLLCVGAYAVWQAFSSGKSIIRVTWSPWKIVLLFVASTWLISTVLNFGLVNGAPVRFYPEPTTDTYNVGETALAALQNDYRALLDRGCLEPHGTSQVGAQLYELRMRCIQSAFVTRVMTQMVFVLMLLFEFLILGRMILHWFFRGLVLRRHTGADEGSSLMLEGLTSVGLGACATIVLLWIFAVTGFYVATAGWMLAALIPLAGVRHAQYWMDRFLHHTWEREYRWWDLSLLLGWLLLSTLALNFLEVVRPFPIGWDDLGSYLNRPRLLVSYGHFIASMSPFDWTYLTSLGFLLFGYDAPFGSTASMMVNWSAGLLAVFAVFALARTFLGKKTGLLSALLYYALPLVGHFSFADMKIDNAIFFFGALATLMLLLALVPPDSASTESERAQHGSAELTTSVAPLLLLSGLFVGFAFATKVTAIMVVFPLGAMLLGMVVHPAAFAGGLLLAFAAFAKQRAFSIGDIMLRITGVAPANDISFWFTMICVVLGITLIAVLLLRGRTGSLRDGWAQHTAPLRLCLAFGIGLFIAVAPWIEHNNIERGRVIPVFDLSAPNTLSPGVDIVNLPAELAVDRSAPACTATGTKEELDRYWGFDHGWAHYLTLPWRTVMNMNSTGYYVTTVPVLLLFPLLLLLPYFWKKEARWLRWLALGTFMMLLEWVFLANGIPWYGVGMLLGFVIGLEALVVHAPDRPNRIVAGTLIAFSLVIAFGMRFWQFEQQRSIFEYSMGKISAVAMREITIPYYGGISAIVSERHVSIPDRPYLYRIGTFISYFIPRNLEVIAINDHQLDVFNCLYQERDPALTVKRLKALGINSIVFDTNTATIENNAQGSLHKKVEAFVNFANDPQSGLQIVVSDEKAGIAYILIP